MNLVVLFLSTSYRWVHPRRRAVVSSLPVWQVYRLLFCGPQPFRRSATSGRKLLRAMSPMALTVECSPVPDLHSCRHRKRGCSNVFNPLASSVEEEFSPRHGASNSGSCGWTHAVTIVHEAVDCSFRLRRTPCVPIRTVGASPPSLVAALC